jgi:hypothetical protein
MFRELSLTDISVVPVTFVSTDFAKTEQTVGLRLMAERTMDAGVISPEEGELWLKDLVQRGRKGGFFRAVTVLRVQGHKPYPVDL